ncbi:MAG: hypothetical protein J6A29_02435 [Clostridia bacterium]|nr:hypothetical protein [Clostridia bacterium]
MKSLEFRNIFFAPDERGKGKITESTKGAKLLVSRDDLKRMINDPETAKFDIPVEDTEKGQDR